MEALDMIKAGKLTTDNAISIMEQLRDEGYIAYIEQDSGKLHVSLGNVHGVFTPDEVRETLSAIEEKQYKRKSEIFSVAQYDHRHKKEMLTYLQRNNVVFLVAYLGSEIIDISVIDQDNEMNKLKSGDHVCISETEQYVFASRNDLEKEFEEV